MARPGRGVAFWAASGVSGLLALTFVNIAADKAAKHPALSSFAEFRDYLVRRNG